MSKVGVEDEGMESRYRYKVRTTSNGMELIFRWSNIGGAKMAIIFIHLRR
ncbi:predicted protein [Sclerotinia sclerotiorum 1980 UF-70]|uniref:Uncharacterized protein n=1 Tax=Sclerotinia sclerotiorum (strain ATCC 18683 / 1980 / Ss-1) TaxID=665079 RepID=A7EZ33_SCLS1|nr:predicted protein [Sclerotinia sclerotiorum 1980 UF-70]EDN94725.1 predicted protein [Sclerotinia sclerotiorum 1980 UF-70]